MNLRPIQYAKAAFLFVTWPLFVVWYMGWAMIYAYKEFCKDVEEWWNAP